jgi:hypothetical protein
MGIKKAEFSADFKNAKCTYKKLFQKYMLHWDFHQKWQVFLEKLFIGAFYVRRCILHFWNQQTILRFFIPIMEDLRNKFADPSYVLPRIFAAKYGRARSIKKHFFCFLLFYIKIKLLLCFRHSDSKINSPYIWAYRDRLTHYWCPFLNLWIDNNFVIG